VPQTKSFNILVLRYCLMDAVRPEASSVQRMFSDIAFRYDFLNRLLSFGIDRLWRREAVYELTKAKPQRILDVATGTADLAIALKQALPFAEVIGVDFAEPMLGVGRRKVSKLGLTLPLVQGDGLNLDYPDNSFEAVSIAYGLRNFSDRARGLEEFYRVLKPGGRVVILEFPPPPQNLFGRLFRLYFLGISPYIAGLFSGRRDAYVYLGKSVLNFPSPNTLASMMQAAGFVKIRYKLQTFGVSALHVAEKPDGATQN
jgi:demethylmenaquinone methyltransferase / 2-methoxy-6-polyprenyl-1,4-benzoquinol methylase